MLNPVAGQRQWAMGVAWLVLGSCALLPWFVSNLAIPAAWLQVADTAVALTAMLAAWMSYLRFTRHSEPPLLPLASGFLFVSLTTWPQLLGVESNDTRLGFVSDLALPLAVIAFLLRRPRPNETAESSPGVGSQVLHSVAGTTVLSIVVIWLLAADLIVPGHEAGDRNWQLTATSLLMAVIAAALVFSWKRGKSKLDPWLRLMLVALAWGTLWRGSELAPLYEGLGILCVLLFLASATGLERGGRKAGTEATLRIIANEIKQPLFAISINADAVTRMIDADRLDLAEIREALADISHDTLRISRALAGAQRLLSSEAETPSDIDVRQLLNECVAQLQPEMSARSVACEVATAPHLPEVRGVRRQLLQMLVNLVGNSLEAMAAVSACERRLRVSASPREGSGVEISVEDSGIGIHRSGPGLDLSHSIAGAHGGNISVTSGPGHGVAFKVVLPASS